MKIDKRIDLLGGGIMRVSKSRLTPDLINGEDVSFEKGETVLYKQQNGSVLNIVIDSVYMQHESGLYGYEAIFSDDGNRYFALSKSIIDWEGKVK
jgi:hypothetical protein